jgi:hypothetical protein
MVNFLFFLFFSDYSCKLFIDKIRYIRNQVFYAAIF